jgi:hypothetical protein
LWDLYENRLKNKYRDQILVTEEQLQAYYKNQRKNFPSKDTLIKWRYLILPMENRDNYKIKKYFFSDDTASAGALEKYFKYFLAYKLDTTGWIRFQEAKKTIPVLDKYVLRKKKISRTYKGKYFLIDIKKVILPGEILPYEYVKPSVTRFVAEKELNMYVRKLQNEMVEKAYKKKQIKLFEQ